MPLEHPLRAVVFVGLPGAGKSTMAQQLYLPKVPNPCYINLDDIRECVRGKVKLNRVVVEAKRIAYTQAEGAVYNGQTVVFVAPNTDVNDRVELLVHLRGVLIDTGYTGYIEGVYLHTPVIDCLRRNAECGRIISDSDMDDMYTALLANPPCEADGFSMLVKHDNSAESLQTTT